ncbi:MAG: 2-isopropylmalate synthase, partial [Clostridiaceae bacterium]|nr:2-isopropylmalate synthase [Clostridiaceae bacterium]
MRIEIMDTTLRDGEQTPGVAFKESEKYNIARILLEEVKVDRIEVASARVSKGEMESVKMITEWAGKRNFLDRVEVLGFVDGKISVDWILEAGAMALNLLCKGSLIHVTNQLKKSPEQHMEDIKNVVSYAREKGLIVNVYLEDWSNGIKNSRDYVFGLVEFLTQLKIERIMLSDTLGILTPYETYEFCAVMTGKYPGVRFDFHAHNDYDLAVANTLMAVKAGVSGIHTTVNGLGERTGNATLSSIVGVLADHCSDAEIYVDETRLNKISKLVEAFSGIRIPANKPIIGESVFTQTSGVHADGDNKANLYYNKLMPERFGRSRKYALGKASGKANILKNLEELGIHLDKDEIAKVTERIVQLGD